MAHAGMGHVTAFDAARPRRLPAFVVTLTLCISLLGGAWPADAATVVPELSATTIVSGDSSAVMRVRVPKAITISIERLNHPQVEVEGDGLYSGIVFASPFPGGPGLSLGSPEAQVSCIPEGCDAKRIVYTSAPVGQEGDLARILPAGEYLLFFVTEEGSHSRIRLTLDELADGVTQLQPTVPIEVPMQRFENTASSPAVDNVWEGGATHDVGSRGLVLSWHVVHWDRPHVATVSDSCTYPGQQPSGSRPWSKNCPGGQAVQSPCDNFLIATVPSARNCDGSVWAVSGPVGQGFNHYSAAVVQKVSSAGVWLSFDIPEELQ